MATTLIQLRKQFRQIQREPRQHFWATSRGIRQHEHCTELRELDIRRTEVEESDVQHFREALPDCEIQW